MRFKTLLLCFLAVCAVSLTSCKKEKNENNKEDYTKNFVGSYDMTIKSIRNIHNLENDQLVVDTINEKGMCNIVQVGDSQNVTLTMDIPTFVPITFDINGTCNENGIVLNEYNIQYMEEEGALSYVVKASTMQLPVDGKITWESEYSGECIIEQLGIPVHIPMDGVFTFEGTKK